MKYQQKINSLTKTNNLNCSSKPSSEGIKSIAFQSLTYSSETAHDSNSDNTSVSFLMQVFTVVEGNEWNLVDKVNALLQVSREEREEMVVMFNNRSVKYTDITCNRTVNLTVKSKISVKNVIDENTAISTSTGNELSTITTSAKIAECNCSVITGTVFGLILPLLVSLLSITCVLLIYTNIRYRKKSR